MNLEYYLKREWNRKKTLGMWLYNSGQKEWKIH